MGEGRLSARKVNFAVPHASSLHGAHAVWHMQDFRPMVHVRVFILLVIVCCTLSPTFSTFLGPSQHLMFSMFLSVVA
jgi:hypothetical protein